MAFVAFLKATNIKKPTLTERRLASSAEEGANFHPVFVAFLKATNIKNQPP